MRISGNFGGGMAPQYAGKANTLNKEIEELQNKIKLQEKDLAECVKNGDLESAAKIRQNILEKREKIKANQDQIQRMAQLSQQEAAEEKEEQQLLEAARMKEDTFAESGMMAGRELLAQMREQMEQQREEG